MADPKELMAFDDEDDFSILVSQVEDDFSILVSQVEWLLDGEGASEDHEDVLQALRNGLSDAEAKKVHALIVNARRYLTKAEFDKRVTIIETFGPIARVRRIIARTTVFGAEVVEEAIVSGPLPKEDLAAMHEELVKRLFRRAMRKLNA